MRRLPSLLAPVLPAAAPRDADAAARLAHRLVRVRLERGAAAMLRPLDANPAKPAQAVVFRVTDGAEVLAYVKCALGPQARARMAQEVAATRDTARRLAADPVSAAPLVLHHDARRAMALLAPLPGRPLVEALRAAGPVARARLFGRAGRLLAACHAPEEHAGAVATVDPAAPLARLRARAAAPDAAPALGSLCDRLERLAARHGPLRFPVGHLHGDMNGTNMLIGDDGTAGLLDFEFARRGPIAPEAARFLVLLSCAAPPPRAARADGPVADADLDAFAAGYAARAPEAATALRGEAFAAACLLALARTLAEAAPWSDDPATPLWRLRRQARLSEMAACAPD